MEILKITRANFKQQRVAYGIKTRDIADICNLSPLTVSNFEKSTGAYTDTNARDYNADMMCQTLESLISRKLDEMFMNKVKEEKDKELEALHRSEIVDAKLNTLHRNVEFARQKQLEQAYPRKPVVENLTKYCMINNITKTDFSKMCGIATTFLTDGSKGIQHVYKRTMDKIVLATGWTPEQIISGSFLTEGKSPRAIEANKAAEAFKENAVAKLETHEKRQNTKYICEDGKYFVEYDMVVVTHHREEINKETFIKEVSK